MPTGRFERFCCVICVWLVAQGARAQHEAPAALVYVRDPVQTPQPELATLPLIPQGAGLRHTLLAAYSCRDTGRTEVQGERVHVCAVAASARADALGHFTATPLGTDAPAHAPDPFAEQMLFHHAARSLQFFAALGVPAATIDSTREPLQLVANVRLPRALAGASLDPTRAGLEPWRDATFLRADEDPPLFRGLRPEPGPVIFFGQADDVRLAYDSAAIRHEVTHAVLSDWLPRTGRFVDAQGTNPAPAAIAEALADYFSAAIADDPRLGAHAGHGLGVAQTRNLNVALSCPAALTGQPHGDGLVLASALWSLRKQLGRELDQALVSALRDLQGVSALSFERLVASLLARLAANHPAAARNASALLRERGLTPRCPRLRGLDVQQSLAGASGAFVLPGAGPSLPLASSSLQLRAALPRTGVDLEVRLRAGATAPRDANSFSPALLVKPSPIRWTERGTHDAQLISPTPGAPSELRFAVPAPRGRELYLQLVNRGEEPGWYDTVRIAFRPAAAR